MQPTWSWADAVVLLLALAVLVLSSWPGVPDRSRSAPVAWPLLAIRRT